MIGVSPTGVSIHEPAFADHAGGAAGDPAVLNGAKALAMMIVNLWADNHHLEAAQTCFEHQVQTF
jgi:hypothetical protein